MAAHRVWDAGVGGSSPPTPTALYNPFSRRSYGAESAGPPRFEEDRPGRDLGSLSRIGRSLAPGARFRAARPGMERYPAVRPRDAGPSLATGPARRERAGDRPARRLRDRASA